MKTKRIITAIFVSILAAMLLTVAAFAESGTWGGIDWTLDEDGTLTIAPTEGEPVNDPNAASRTYEVGEWRENVKYKSNGSASAIGTTPYDCSKVTKLIIKEGVTSIGSFSAQSMTNVTGELVIPSTVTYIGQEAFQKSKFTKLIFAEGNTEPLPLCIANGAFKQMDITEIVLPEDREYIHVHHWAFGGNLSLKKANIPANVTKVWGGEHVDYFDNFNAQSNVTWANYSCLFSGGSALEKVTFGSEEVRDMFFAHDNGVVSYKNGSYNGDYLVGSVGLTAYGDNAVEEMAEALAKGGTLLLYRPCDADITVDGELNIIFKNKDAAFTGDIVLKSYESSVTVTLPSNKTFGGNVVPYSGEYLISAKVDENGVLYYTHCDSILTHEGVDTPCNFDEAIANAVDGDTITLNTDVKYNIGANENTVSTMAIGQGVIIDLNGKTISPADPTLPTFVSNEMYIIQNGTIEGDVVIEAGDITIEDVVIDGDLDVNTGSVEITSGGVTGDIAVEDNANVEITGGDYSFDVSEYVPADKYDVVRTSDGYTIAPKELQADTISVEFMDITVEGIEGEKTYEVYVKANDNDNINELASLDLTFVYTATPVNGGAIDFTVAPDPDFTMTRLGETDRYMFNYSGEKFEETANAIPFATITVTGYGAYTIAVDNADTNIVNATTVNDNLVDFYTAKGAEDNDETTGGLIINTDTVDGDGMVGKIENGSIAIPTRKLTINITFPNAVNPNEAEYQDMKVEITGNIDGVTKTVTYDLGGNMTTDGKYVVTENKLVLNNAYTVTVSGAGYRTARYTVTMTDNKTLNFWNNVKDNAFEVEVGKSSSAKEITFLAGDIVKDSVINIYDLSAVVSYFGETGLVGNNNAYAKYDLNRDGKIDSKDVAYVLVSWGN